MSDNPIEQAQPAAEAETEVQPQATEVAEAPPPAEQAAETTGEPKEEGDPPEAAA